VPVLIIMLVYAGADNKDYFSEVRTRQHIIILE